MSMALQGIGFAYPGGREVLRGVTAEFPAGEVTAVIGPNGSGKSTLLRILLGVLEPQSGGVLLAGQNLNQLSPGERAARIAYVPQKSHVAFPFSVREVVRLGRYASRRNGHDAVDAALREVDIADRADDAFGVLSAGQQQRVTVARALAQLDLVGETPDSRADRFAGCVLLADEPVSAMDPRHVLATMDLFSALAKRAVTVVVVLHDLNLVLRYAARVIVLRSDGAIAGAGPVAQVMTPDLLEGVFSVRFRELMDPGGGRAALVPVDRSSPSVFRS